MLFLKQGLNSGGGGSYLSLGVGRLHPKIQGSPKKKEKKASFHKELKNRQVAFLKTFRGLCNFA